MQTAYCQTAIAGNSADRRVGQSVTGSAACLSGKSRGQRLPRSRAVGWLNAEKVRTGAPWIFAGAARKLELVWQRETTLGILLS